MAHPRLHLCSGTPSPAPAVKGPRVFFSFPSTHLKALMTQPTPAPATDEEKKRMREKVEKLLAQSPHTSEGTISLGGRTMAYTVNAAFVPIAAGGLDEKRGDPDAAVFTIAYQLKDTD